MAQTVPHATTKLLDSLESGSVTKIKLIGDSITVGVGSTNGGEDPAGTIIFTDPDTSQVYREGYKNSLCWANFFRNYIQADFGSISFFNAGIGGKSALFANQNKTLWVDDNEDVVFVMLGTNDRQQNTLSGFKTDITNFLDYVDQRSNLMIVMSPPPTLNDGEAYYNFGIKEVDKVITDVCKEKNYLHLSNYRDFLEFVGYSKSELKNLLETNGSHPIDAGYLSLWRNIQQKLAIIDNTKNWDNEPLDSIINLTTTEVTTTTPIMDDIFSTKGAFYYSEITDDNSDKANFPIDIGILTTYRASVSDTHSFQEYRSRYDINTIYRRVWSFVGGVWADWSMQNDHPIVNIQDDISLVTNATPITEPVFRVAGKTTFLDITADVGFPTSTGTLVTYRGIANDLWSYQEWRVRNSNSLRRRVWDVTNDIWKAWEILH